MASVIVPMLVSASSALPIATRPSSATVSGRAARQAKLQVRVAHLTLQPPQRGADDPGVWLEPLHMWALWLHEMAAPEGVEPLDWLLLTNVPIQTWQDGPSGSAGIVCAR